MQETRNFNASLDESDAAIQGALDDAEAKRAALEEQAIAAAASQAQKALSSLRPALDNARSPLADLDDGHSPAVMQLIATVDTSTAEADSAIEAVENKVITFEQLTTSEAARELADDIANQCAAALERIEATAKAVNAVIQATADEAAAEEARATALSALGAFTHTAAETLAA